MADGKGSSSSAYGTPNSNPFLSTRSRRRKEPILLTCDSEHGSQRAGGDGAVRLEFYGDGIFSRGCSGSKDVR
jgi:hypothetical protein